MSGFYADNDEFRVDNSDGVSFTTVRPSVSLMPDDKITITTTVTFPNLYSTIMYLHRAIGGTNTACETWSALLVQECGPHVPTTLPVVNGGSPGYKLITTNLPATTLGTVPVGTNYLDVRARIRRTTTPPVFGNQYPPLTFHPEDQWINLPGGSCLCEFYSPLARSFDVVLSGTDVLLNRYQSTKFDGQTTNTTGGDDPGNADSTQIGSSWGNYAQAPVYWAQRAVLFAVKAYDGNGNKRPPWGSTSTNSCSTGSVVNYTSVYEVDFEITPGRYDPT